MVCSCVATVNVATVFTVESKAGKHDCNDVRVMCITMMDDTDHTVIYYY